ncbi:MAG TPA: DegT/DnrJ/EryC1/StrS family aminotransferase [Micromonospora sp.]|nr:DegT/DnrJ/EryC1/StrS family aminotransferase [Micromonospora sp.]
MTVPFFNPELLASERETLLKSIYEVATDGEQRFILGRRTAEMEKALRDQLGVGDAIACASGTGALTLALRALRIGPGDEVIVPAFGSEPIAGTVLDVGATPVFADVDPVAMVIDVADVERLITERTRAVVPAHVFSMMADMPALTALAARHGIEVLEDAAIGQGAVLNGRPAGLWGVLGLYSFFPLKPFGMPGEGAVVLTNDADLGRRVRMLRNHGQDGVHRFTHHMIGVNSRFDEILAHFQLQRMPELAQRLEQRALVVDYYTERFTPLRDHGVIAPPFGRDGRCCYVYALVVAERDRMRAHLAERGVGSYVHYPVPLPRLAAFAPYADGGDWPGAERASAQHLAIPLWGGMTEAEMTRVADAVCDFVS